MENLKLIPTPKARNNGKQMRIVADDCLKTVYGNILIPCCSPLDGYHLEDLNDFKDDYFFPENCRIHLFCVDEAINLMTYEIEN